MSLALYAPEGFETRMLTEDLLRVMRRSGFRKIHLPFETLTWDTNISWNRRHASTASFDAALEAAIRAGYSPRTQDINAFVLFGLPDEKLQEIMDGVLYVHNRVGSIIQCCSRRYLVLISTKHTLPTCMNRWVGTCKISMASSCPSWNTTEGATLASEDLTTWTRSLNVCPQQRETVVTSGERLRGLRSIRALRSLLQTPAVQFHQPRDLSNRDGRSAEASVSF